MRRVRPTVVKSTILILQVLGPGVQLALTVSNNDSVSFLKSIAAANLWQRMSHPGLASPDERRRWVALRCDEVVAVRRRGGGPGPPLRGPGNATLAPATYWGSECRAPAAAPLPASFALRLRGASSCCVTMSLARISSSILPS